MIEKTKKTNQKTNKRVNQIYSEPTLATSPTLSLTNLHHKHSHNLTGGDIATKNKSQK